MGKRWADNAAGRKLCGGARKARGGLAPSRRHRAPFSPSGGKGRGEKGESFPRPQQPQQPHSTRIRASKPRQRRAAKSPGRAAENSGRSPLAAGAGAMPPPKPAGALCAPLRVCARGSREPRAALSPRPNGARATAATRRKPAAQSGQGQQGSGASERQPRALPSAARRLAER